jgi:glycolate oxidase FAD binding subunit
MTAVRPLSADELAELLRDAAAAQPGSGARTGYRIRGAGTWSDAGSADPRATPLELGALKGVSEYAPADLTISVGSATTLAELDDVTRVNGQWCPLLPWGDDRSTVGATIATATSGPFAESLGRPRDLVLGLECVDGRGRIIRAGGRVVKNVAGFDLTRLMTGAWGTLGVITAVHLRLRSRPLADETWALQSADAAAVDAFRRGAGAPLACTALTPRLANAVGADVGAGWLVRIGGNARFTAAARSALRALGPCEPLPDSAWTALRATHAPGSRTDTWKWDALSRRIKATFDPGNVLNPGLLGDPR